MNPNEYESFINGCRERIIDRTGWEPRCPSCWLKNYMTVGESNSRTPILKIRFSVISGGKDGDMPHEDIHLKCPECQYHQTHGWRVTTGEIERTRELTGTDGYPIRFNAVRDAPRDEIKERMRALGYLE